MITPEQSRAARALLNWSQDKLAEVAHIGIVTVRQFELGNTTPRFLTLQAMRQVLEEAGVIFVDENGEGAGVRLRKKPKHSGG
jgi:transcriptional regulator with XRE-family HTH domain